MKLPGTRKGGAEPPRNDASEDETRHLQELNRIVAVKWWRYRHLFLKLKQRELALRQDGGDQ